MSPTIAAFGLDRLPREDRIALVQELWDSIADEGSGLPISEARRAELERRADEDDASPDELIPWEQVKLQARERFRS
jgi:putative addiction module component (TIGR02574 family)